MRMMMEQVNNNNNLSDIFSCEEYWRTFQEDIKIYQKNNVQKNDVTSLRNLLALKLQDLRREAIRSQDPVTSHVVSAVQKSVSTSLTCKKKTVDEEYLTKMGYYEISTFKTFSTLIVQQEYVDKSWTSLLTIEALQASTLGGDVKLKCKVMRKSKVGTSSRVDLFIDEIESKNDVIIREDLVQRSGLCGIQRSTVVTLERFRCHNDVHAQVMLSGLLLVLSNDAHETILQLMSIRAHANEEIDVEDDRCDKSYTVDNGFERYEAETLKKLGFRCVDDYYRIVIPIGKRTFEIAKPRFKINVLELWSRPPPAWFFHIG